MRNELIGVDVILLGGGGHAAVIADAASSSGIRIKGFFDDDQSQALADIKRLGSIESFNKWLDEHLHPVAIHAAVGNGKLREQWSQLITHRTITAEFSRPRLLTIAHARSVIAKSAELGSGTFIGPRAVVNARTKLGSGVIVNTGAIVEHDCTVGEWSHISPGAILAGNVTVGSHSLIGIGACVNPGITIGNHVTIGAGAVIIRDIEDDQIVVGNPGHVIPSKR